MDKIKKAEPYFWALLIIGAIMMAIAVWSEYGL